jgi:hypothetical protein
MIRHCVFIRFKPEIDAAGRSGILAMIAALQPRIPGLLQVHIGRNVSPEGLDKGFSDGFVVDFADAKARDTYLVDPEHAKAGAAIVAAAVGAGEGIIVYDIEVDG